VPPYLPPLPAPLLPAPRLATLLTSLLLLMMMILLVSMQKLPWLRLPLPLLLLLPWLFGGRSERGREMAAQIGGGSQRCNKLRPPNCGRRYKYPTPPPRIVINRRCRQIILLQFDRLV